MTPAEAGAALAKMQADASPPPPLVPATAADARARLDILSKDKGWADRLFAGDVTANREFKDLTALAGSADDTAEAIAGTTSPQPLFETTTGGQLPRRHVNEIVASMREAGLSDGAIGEALNGGKVTRAEMAAAKAFKNMRHGDAEWVKRFLAGSYAERRENMLLSIILTSEIKDG
jgi:hypothetical protein